MLDAWATLSSQPCAPPASTAAATIVITITTSTITIRIAPVTTTVTHLHGNRPHHCHHPYYNDYYGNYLTTIVTDPPTSFLGIPLGGMGMPKL